MDGRADLDAGILRAIGAPADRFAEDHLRMLRAVRFVACLGVQLESATETAIAAHAGELSGVSRERIGEEVRRLLHCPRHVEGVALFERLGLGAAVFGTSAADASFSRLESAGHAGAELPALLAAWSLDRGDSTDLERGVRIWRESLLLSNEHRDGMRSCLRSHRMFQEWEAMGVAPRKRLASSPWSAAALSMIEAVDPERAATIRRDIDMLATSGLSPARLLDGDTLVADGMPPGIRFGEVLEQVYDAQLEGRIHTLDEAIQLGRELSGR